MNHLFQLQDLTFVFTSLFGHRMGQVCLAIVWVMLPGNAIVWLMNRSCCRAMLPGHRIAHRISHCISHCISHRKGGKEGGAAMYLLVLELNVNGI
jgi:hypothetical protein